MNYDSKDISDKVKKCIEKNGDVYSFDKDFHYLCSCDKYCPFKEFNFVYQKPYCRRKDVEDTKKYKR